MPMRMTQTYHCLGEAAWVLVEQLGHGGWAAGRQACYQRRGCAGKERLHGLARQPAADLRTGLDISPRCHEAQPPVILIRKDASRLPLLTKGYDALLEVAANGVNVPRGQAAGATALVTATGRTSRLKACRARARSAAVALAAVAAAAQQHLLAATRATSFAHNGQPRNASSPPLTGNGASPSLDQKPPSHRRKARFLIAVHNENVVPARRRDLARPALHIGVDGAQHCVPERWVGGKLRRTGELEQAKLTRMRRTSAAAGPQRAR
jgi:hypothetical protein